VLHPARESALAYLAQNIGELNLLLDPGHKKIGRGCVCGDKRHWFQEIKEGSQLSPEKITKISKSANGVFLWDRQNSTSFYTGQTVEARHFRGSLTAQIITDRGIRSLGRSFSW
jgi:hypothetical protein